MKQWAQRDGGREIMRLPTTDFWDEVDGWMEGRVCTTTIPSFSGLPAQHLTLGRIYASPQLFKKCDWPSMKQEITFKWCGFASHITLLRHRKGQGNLGKQPMHFIVQSPSISISSLAHTTLLFVCRIIWRLAMAHTAAACASSDELMRWEKEEEGTKGENGMNISPFVFFGSNFTIL